MARHCRAPISAALIVNDIGGRPGRSARLANVLADFGVIIAQHAIPLLANDIFGKRRNLGEVAGITYKPIRVVPDAGKEVSIVGDGGAGKADGLDQALPRTAAPFGEWHGHFGGKRSLPSANIAPLQPLSHGKHRNRTNQAP